LALPGSRRWISSNFSASRWSRSSGGAGQYNYDNGDRVTSAVWKSAAGATVNLLTYTYDNNDNLLTAKDGSGTVTYTNVFGMLLHSAFRVLFALGARHGSF
jgi:hypothetical protein